MVYTLQVFPKFGEAGVNLKYAPWGYNPLIEWDEYNLEKIWHHGIRRFEIEQCFRNIYFVRPHEKARSQPEKYANRYFIRGVTDGGRKLMIIVEYKGMDLVRPITAWELK